MAAQPPIQRTCATPTASATEYGPRIHPPLRSNDAAVTPSNAYTQVRALKTPGEQGRGVRKFGTNHPPLDRTCARPDLGGHRCPRSSHHAPPQAAPSSLTAATARHTPPPIAAPKQPDDAGPVTRPCPSTRRPHGATHGNDNYTSTPTAPPAVPPAATSTTAHQDKSSSLSGSTHPTTHSGCRRSAPPATTARQQPSTHPYSPGSTPANPHNTSSTPKEVGG